MRKFQVALLAAFSQAPTSTATTSSSAAIDLNLSKFDPALQTDYSRTLSYEENTNYEPCLCNLTSQSCDAYCCCDVDCKFDTRAAWADQKKCANYDYKSQANGLSLSDCITKKELYEYNRKRGLTNYIDPFAQLFCVRFNYSPKMDFYWNDKAEITASEISDLRLDQEKAGFYSTLIGEADAGITAPLKEYYAQGEKMYSEICDSAGQNCKPQYLGAFPLPFANVYGLCNKYSSANFMESESNECTQIVDLVAECESTLNPEFYTTRIKFFAGQKPSSDNPALTISNVYKLKANPANADLLEYIDTQTTTVSASVFDSSLTACKNVLKEIAYTVNVSEVDPDANDPVSNKPYLKIDSISALVVVQDAPVTAQLDSEGRAMASVQQRFSIKFEKRGSSGELVGGKSGNPGYIDGLPLLIGKKQQAQNGAVQVSEDGFRIRGGDAAGKCISGAIGDLSEMGDPLLKFNVDLSYGCTLEYTLDELRDQCNPAKAPLSNLAIFRNLDNIDSFGRFGNAYVYYPKDWEAIAAVPTFQLQGQAEWVAADDEQTCRIYANVHYKIIYAEMGFSENLQKYIVKIEKSSEKQLWKFNRKLTTDKQKFPVFVSFQYVKLERADVDGEGIDLRRNNWWNLHEDLFYPFSSKSKAVALPALAVTLAASILLTLVAI